MGIDVSWMLGRVLVEAVFVAPASWFFRFGQGVEMWFPRVGREQVSAVLEFAEQSLASR
jgi:hypothetical protein